MGRENTILRTKRVSRYFGGLRAVDDLDVDVYGGEILGVIGPNGAGKTTLFNLLSGFLQPSQGKIFFKGEDITGLTPHTIAQKGLVRTFQHMPLWPDFSVIDTIRLALHKRSGIGTFESIFNTPSCRKKESRIDEIANEILEFIEMKHIRDNYANTLSHGYQRTLSLGIAIAVRPPMLLLDEPLAALNPERCSSIIRLIRQIRESGTTIMIIEHNMRAIFDLCDRISVISEGRKISEGSPNEIKDDPVVVSAYLGVKPNVT